MEGAVVANQSEMEVEAKERVEVGVFGGMEAVAMELAVAAVKVLCTARLTTHTSGRGSRNRRWRLLPRWRANRVAYSQPGMWHMPLDTCEH